MIHSCITYQLSDNDGHKIRMEIDTAKGKIHVYSSLEPHAILDEEYLARILICICAGKAHLPHMPGLCQCKKCFHRRMKILAANMLQLKKEADEIDSRPAPGSFEFESAGGHSAVPCTDNADICQLCGCHVGNHDQEAPPAA